MEKVGVFSSIYHLFSFGMEKCQQTMQSDKNTDGYGVKDPQYGELIKEIIGF